MRGKNESSEIHTIDKAKDNALRMMKETGFAISDKLRVVVDPKLPFMGYSTRREGIDVIVVSGRALKSGMIEGLLVHEMSHIYRTNANHPSHNHGLLNKVGRFIIDRNRLREDHQITVVQQAVNHIQDLYADDIAFRVFGQCRIFPHGQAFEFFLDWINDKPYYSKNTKTKWLNTGIMLNNCFALSDMIRHNVPDVNDEAEKKVERFLSHTDERMKREFAYIKSLMIRLKESITDKEFEKSLTEYLTRIVKLAN
jgi:hypothetical protein